MGLITWQDIYNDVLLWLDLEAENDTNRGVSGLDDSVDELNKQEPEFSLSVGNSAIMGQEVPKAHVTTSV